MSLVSHDGGRFGSLLGIRHQKQSSIIWYCKVNATTYSTNKIDPLYQRFSSSVNQPICLLISYILCSKLASWSCYTFEYHYRRNFGGYWGPTPPHILEGYCTLLLFRKTASCIHFRLHTCMPSATLSLTLRIPWAQSTCSSMLRLKIATVKLYGSSSSICTDQTELYRNVASTSDGRRSACRALMVTRPEVWNCRNRRIAAAEVPFPAT